MSKSRISEITFVKEWEAPDGTVYYYHSIEFENGDSGKAPFKSKNQHSIGDFVEYTLNGDRVNIVKSEKSQNKGSSGINKGGSPFGKAPKTYTSSGKRSKEDYLGFVYGYAKDIHIATMQVTGKKVPLSELKKNVEEMYAHIEELLNMEQ